MENENQNDLKLFNNRGIAKGADVGRDAHRSLLEFVDRNSG